MNTRQVMPEQIFAGLGGGRVAYVRPIKSEALAAAFPNVPPLAPDLELWVLHGADGRPIMVADTRDAAVQNAWEQDLETVSLH